MRDKRLYLTLTLLALLLIGTAQAQQRTVVTKITNLPAQSTFVQLDLVAKWSGPELGDVRLRASIAPDLQIQLQKLVYKYPHAEWLVSLSGGSDGIMQITTAFRHSSNNSELIDSFPPPLSVPLEELSRVDEHKQRSVAVGAEELEVIYLTNLARKEEGLAPLKQESHLNNSADGHSNRMATTHFFAHCDIHTKKSPFVRMQDAGYNWNGAAENIAAGQTTAQEVMYSTYGWLNSPGHRANIMSTSYREIGAGYAFSNDSNKDEYDQNGDCNGDASGGPFRRYWTQNFGLRSSVYPVVINLEAEATDSRVVNLFVYGPSGAEEMRFKNGNGDWSGWMNYSPNHSWTLGDRNGAQIVYAEVRRGSAIYRANDAINLNWDCGTLVVQNETLSGTQTLDDCEVILKKNVQVTGKITIQAGEVSIETNNEVKAGATLEIKAGN